ncbi:Wzz/FepE/Etk N-terminal domain-containing protein, partial [Vibrio alginolyticus]|uniref:Wzz/FepE/Etk N-terminal domain-containing protein n=2 Tax=Vibrio TaxID=662 RepID=UPI003D7C9302
MESKKESYPSHLAYSSSLSTSSSDEIDFRELFTELWKGKWIIIISTFVFAVGSVLY